MSSSDLFMLDDNNKGTRGHFWKLGKFRCAWDRTASCIFSNRVINIWIQLDQQATCASSINAFKGCLNENNKGMASSWTNPPSYIGLIVM